MSIQKSPWVQKWVHYEKSSIWESYSGEILLKNINTSGVIMGTLLVFICTDKEPLHFGLFAQNYTGQCTKRLVLTLARTLAQTLARMLVRMLALHYQLAGQCQLYPIALYTHVQV